MKKKQSSNSLARSLASSQSGPIKTPKTGMSEKENRASAKSKMEWWRGRSASFVGRKEVNDEKVRDRSSGWLRQSEVWMAPQGILQERVASSRSDGLPALPSFRSVPHLPLAKENIPLTQHDFPVIRKKTSLGAFRFKNFFQTKTKDSSERKASQSRPPLFAPTPLIRPAILHNGMARSTSFTRFEEVPNRPRMAPPRPPSSFRDQAQPRLPLIATSVARLNSYSSPRGNDNLLDETSSSLPYMYGVGDGWSTPCPPQLNTEYKERTETAFPFPPAAASLSRDPSNAFLHATTDTGRHQRAPSAAFEYQEFETTLRNSARLSSIVGDGDSVTEANKPNAVALNINTTSAVRPIINTAPSDSRAQSYRVIDTNKNSTARLESGSLRPTHSLERSCRSPLIESPKPLSIGRNHPRGRPLVPTKSNDRYISRQTQYHIEPTEEHDSATSITPPDFRVQEGGRLRRTLVEEPRTIPRDSATDSFGDPNTCVQDLV
ncbi:hypothetical protein NliqN6_3273 [Naganishia liquefaciens]|uniref:Uncharacterized protein n=1 Tax=Naganishia liquefaciens TaxID=104408 RepID=A0A8H3TTX2_9TREE|nr:hypothetical protein NliqN6_3273 [Naganishia liquefaciens]